MRIPSKQSAAAPSRDAPALSKLLRRLVAAYDPERIYLLGSVARGEAGPDSDYDLMIIRVGRCYAGKAAEPFDVSGDAGNGHGG